MSFDPNKAREEIKKLNQEIADLYLQLNRTSAPPIFKLEELEKANDYIVGLKTQLKVINEELDYISISFRRAIADISKKNTELAKVKSTMGSLSNLATQLKIETENLSKIDLKRIDSLEKRIKAQYESLRIAELSLKTSKFQSEEDRKMAKMALNEAREALKTQKEFLAAIEQTRRQQVLINKDKGVRLFEGLDDLIKLFPGIRKISPIFEDMAKASKETAAYNLETYGDVKGMSKEEYQKKVEESKKLHQQDLNQLNQLSKLNPGKGNNPHLTVSELEKTDIGQQILKQTKGKGGSSASAVARSMYKSLEAQGPEEIAKSLTPLQAGIKALGPAIQKAFGPFYLLYEFVQAFSRVNKESVELQKSMTLTSREASSFRADLGVTAALTGDINITTSKLLKSFTDLNKQFGFITNFSNDTLVTMTKLTTVVGISSTSAGNLAAASLLTGKSFEQNYKDVLGTSHELQVQEGVQIDLRDILEQTGKVTGITRANLGSNPKLIAEAVTQAKLFGATLEQVANTSNMLLNFQQSIENELQAELLLGKNINLEKARLAALNGDQVTLAKELRKEAGDYESFMKMNVIQQQALASALGMQSNELADILFQQDIQGKTAKELRALGKDQLADRLEAQTIQDKFNNSVEKLKEIFADVANALMPVFELFGNIFKIVGFIVTPISLLINGATKLSGVLGVIVGLLAAAAISALVLNGSLTLGLGTIAVLAAVGAGIAYMESEKSKAMQVGDIVSEAKGKTTISTKEGGLYELSENDDIIAAPGVAKTLTRSSDKKPPLGEFDILDKTNTILNNISTQIEEVIKQNNSKQQISPVGLYEVQ